MNPHAPKCWLGLHDWHYSTERTGDVVFTEKECTWCDATTVDVSYRPPRESSLATEGQ